jgi:uncharacterized membrane protein/ribosomal protein L40E
MTKLGDAKIVGGVGSILLLIPGVSIIGYILILIAAKYISDELKDSSIFDNMLYAVIAGIVGVAAAAFIIFTGAIFSVSTFTISSMAGLIVGLVVAWIALIISSIFIRRAYERMATGLSVGTFRTAGLLYFIGAILTIVLVGFILLLVAAILQIIAFFSINEMAQGMRPQAAATPAVQAGMKFCPTCGAQLSATATFCSKCGAKQPP